MSFRASDHRDGRRKKNLNLGVHPPDSSVGGGCYDRFVIEASRHLSDGHLEALAAAASMLQWPLPRERDEAVCHRAVRAVESLLVRVGRCQGALEVRIGEGLDALGIGDRVIRLGFSGTGDYARERLGVAASTAQKMARLARELRSRPLLRAAVREGRVSTSAAEAVLKVEQGEAEAFWVARARTQTVRALEAAVKEPGGVERIPRPGRAGRRARTEPGWGDRPLAHRRGAAKARGVSLCAVHHLRGVHMGRLRVSGTAPDQLRWEVSAGAGEGPLVDLTAPAAGPRIVPHRPMSGSARPEAVVTASPVDAREAR